MSEFVLCARNVNDDGTFGDDTGDSVYLVVPDGAEPKVSMKEDDPKVWGQKVIDAARQPDGSGDILVFIHGYNNPQLTVLERHVMVRDAIRSAREHPFRGVVVSFDWPCSNSALAYLPDRVKAKETALTLVTGGIALLASFQRPDCKVNVHLLAHSTGAFVVREAFDDADDRHFENGGWKVSQICLISGDVSSRSMSETNAESESVYNHCVRLTNYENSHDEVLGLSNVKRFGVAPRVGRTGLPDDAPDAAVNVDCSDFYRDLPPEQKDLVYSHSWHFTNPTFMQDLALVIDGVDRGSMSTRLAVPGRDNRFLLRS